MQLYMKASQSATSDMHQPIKILSSLSPLIFHILLDLNPWFNVHLTLLTGNSQIGHCTQLQKQGINNKVGLCCSTNFMGFRIHKQASNLEHIPVQLLCSTLVKDWGVITGCVYLVPSNPFIWWLRLDCILPGHCPLPLSLCLCSRWRFAERNLGRLYHILGRRNETPWGGRVTIRHLRLP